MAPSAERYPSLRIKSDPSRQKQFRNICPGGSRGTPTYYPDGFFVILDDHEAGEIMLRHYLANNTPIHETRGRRAEVLVRGLVWEGLASQLSHAGNQGVELARVETVLQLGLEFEQDRPIRTSF